MIYEWGDRLASILRHRGISQRSLAKSIGVTPQAVSKWIAGGEIEHTTLRDTAKFLSVNWVWLRYGNDALADSMDFLQSKDRVAIFMHKTIRCSLESDQYYRATCAALGIGSWEVNLETGKSYWSPTARLLMGVDTETEATQSELRSRLIPADVPGMDRAMREAAKSSKSFWQRFRMKEEPETVLVALGRSIKGREGQVERIIGLMSNELLLSAYQLLVVDEQFANIFNKNPIKFGT